MDLGDLSRALLGLLI
uniref:Uncharacterized protein n=1 Tax=Rhizophora mucronata TaxID=61149 RepID=A0A2P2P0K6_RHIMU